MPASEPTDPFRVAYDTGGGEVDPAVRPGNGRPPSARFLTALAARGFDGQVDRRFDPKP
jgi:hypothetical protein